MITELLIPTQIVAVDVWEFPIDVFTSSRRNIVKDKLRRFKLTKKTPDSADFVLQCKTYSERRIQVKENLWRVIDGLTEWRDFFSAELIHGNHTLDTESHRYRYSLFELNDKGYEIAVAYQFRNAAAERAGRLIFGTEA